MRFFTILSIIAAFSAYCAAVARVIVVMRDKNIIILSLAGFMVLLVGATAYDLIKQITRNG